MKNIRPPKKTAGKSGRPAADPAAPPLVLPRFDENYRILFDTMSQGVIFRDAEGRTLSANPAAERILGRALAELLGRTSAEIYTGALQEDGTLLPPDAFPADVALRTGKPLADFVMSILNPAEQRYRWISVNAVPIFRPGESRPFLVYILFDDITERRSIARELQKAHDHLEHEVQERTRELAGANEELSAQIAVRKKAEAALRASEGKFRRFAENAEFLIYLYQLLPERKFEYVSPSSTKLTGYTPEEHYVNPDLRFQIVHAGDRNKLADSTARTPDQVQPLLLRWVRKDGRTIWIEQRDLAVTDATGTIVAIQGTARDVTERVWAEERLRESEKFLQTIIETEPECVKMLGADGTVLMMNRAGLDMLQAESLAQVRGKTAISFIAPEHHRPFSALLENVFRGAGGMLTFEMVGFKGRRLWMDTHMVPLRDEKGRIIAALCITRDISEQRRAEQFAKNILETVDEDFLVIDRSFTILSANRAYYERTGRGAAEIIGKKCWEVTHRSSQPCYEQDEECAVHRSFETGSPQSAMHTHHDAKGNLLIVETKAFPIRDETGRITGAIEIINNVTEKKRLEDQLRHVQKMEAVGLLAGGISHDFNNILTAIIGYGNLVKMKVPADGLLQSYIDQILASAARAANLTQSLLAFSRKQIINPRPLDLNDSIRRFEKLLHRVISEDVDIRTDLAPGEMTVLADSSQVEQILMNLATNARDAMPQGGSLLLRTETAIIDAQFRDKHGFGAPGSYACVSVQDTGPGMDPMTLDRIFEPFFTTKQPGEGTGLGLAIVYGIMKQNSGYITVSSTPGRGTCFRLYFPLIAAVAGPSRDLAAPSLDEGHETILVAEDDLTIRQLTATMLGEFGYTVIEAVDGEDAIRKFREHRDDIELVILDVVMPKKNGKEAHDAIVALKPEVKTLYISGYNTDFISRKGITEDTANFLLKPLSPMDLLRSVRRILDSGEGALTPPSR